MSDSAGALKIALCAINTRYSQCSTAPELLVSYASKYLGEAGFTGREIAFEKHEFCLADSPEFIARRLFSSRAGLFGFSVYIWNFEVMRRLVAYARSAFPEAITVAGGPETVSAVFGDPDAACGAHFAVCGEGEESFARLLETILLARRNGESPFSGGPEKFVSIEGVAADASIFDKTDIGPGAAPAGGYYGSGRIAVVRDPSTIPSIYTAKFLGGKKRNYVYLETSRGCPGRCYYCLSSLKSEGVPDVRRYPIERVASEIDAIAAVKGIECVRVIDRTFNEDRARAVAIFEKVVSSAPDGVKFQFEISPAGFDEAMVAWLKVLEKPCLRFEIGVQSFEPSVLRSVGRGGGEPEICAGENIQKKRYTSSEIVDVLVNETPVEVHADLMYGLPADTFDGCVSSFDRLLSMFPQSVQFWQLKLLRGTRLRDEAESLGIVYEKFPPYPVVRTSRMGAPDIMKLQRLGRFLDVLYNHGHIGTAVKFFIRSSGRPSDFFFAAADFFDRNSIPESAVSRAGLFEHMKNFAAERFLPADRRSFEAACDCLRYDFVAAEKKKFSLPDFLKRPPRRDDDGAFEEYHRELAASKRKIAMSRSVSVFGFGFDVAAFSKIQPRSVMTAPLPAEKEIRMVVRHFVREDGAFDAGRAFFDDPSDVFALDFLSHMDKNTVKDGGRPALSPAPGPKSFESVVKRLEGFVSAGFAVDRAAGARGCE